MNYSEGEKMWSYSNYLMIVILFSLNDFFYVLLISMWSGERENGQTIYTSVVATYGVPPNTPVFASGQVGLQIAGRLSVRPGQAKVRLTWAFQARLHGAWRCRQAFGKFLMTGHYFVKGWLTPTDICLFSGLGHTI